MKKVYRTILISAIVLSVLLAFLRYDVSLERLIGSIVDLATSLVYYFRKAFLHDSNYIPTVNELPQVDLSQVIGIDLVELQRKLAAFPDAFFIKENFGNYNTVVLLKLTLFMQMCLPSLVLFGFFCLFINKYLEIVNNDYGKETSFLKLFFRMFTKPYRVAKSFLKGFFEFARGSIYFKALLWIWAINLNILSIAIGFLAYYFYFSASVTFSSLGIQILKLLVDLIVMFSGLSIVIWLIIGWWVLDIWRKARGLDKLHHLEAMNFGFLKTLPLLIFLIGGIGSKKTMTVTDMVLTYNFMFRQRALEGIRKFERWFCNFKWILFERTLKKAIKKHIVYNLITARNFVDSLQARYLKKPSKKRIWNYNTIDNSMTYDDGNVVRDIWYALKEYAQLYLIYVVQTCYAIANYSIRFNTVKIDYGNFPLFQDEFFDTPSTCPGDGSTYAHILDWETLRLGKTIHENNIKRGSFDFGILVWSEVSKERLNQNGTSELKMNDSKANQKNDGLNEKVELLRHGATVDFFPFVVVLDDAQRPDSLNAGLRQQQTIVNIADTSDDKLAMPGFVFEEMIHDLMKLVDNIRLKFRVFRGDRSLISWIIDQIHSKFENYYERIWNKFGYQELTLELEDGLSGEFRTHPYYLSRKKIRADRYATDAQGDYIDKLSLRSGQGINDIPMYKGSRATVEELRLQNSFFFERMFSFDYNDEQEIDNDDSDFSFFG